VLAGLVSLVAGVLILERMISVGPNPVALITALAFLGFGVYRSLVAVTRYREYRQRMSGRCGLLGH